MQRLVKAKTGLEFGDEIRIKTLGAAVLAAEGVAAARIRQGLTRAGARDPLGHVGTDSGEL